MIAEGREIAAIHPNMVVKIPMTAEGLKAIKVLSAEGIPTNCTLIFSANQHCWRPAPARLTSAPSWAGWMISTNPAQI